MWAGSGRGKQKKTDLDYKTFQTAGRELAQVWRRRRENFFCRILLLLFFCWIEIYFLLSKVSPIHEEDVLKLSGGGDWHTAYLLIYGPRWVSASKVLILYFLFQKASQAARPEDGSRHHSSGCWRGEDGKLGGKWKLLTNELSELGRE